LAGGASTRMGMPKALLTAPDGRSFVTRIADVLLAGGVDRLVIVTGRHHQEIADATRDVWKDAPVSLVQNPDWDRGQLSSLWVGMDAVVGPATEALVVTLVDVPLVSVDLVRQLLQAWHATKAPIVRPAIGARHGHPVVFDRSVFDDLRVAPLDLGAKAVLHAHAARILDVPVNDPGCTRDVDTPDDYTSLRR